MLNQFKEGHAVSVSLKDFSGNKIPIIGYIGLVMFLISSILDLIITVIYGTINNILGPIVVEILLLALILILTSMMWYLTKMKENSKISYHFQLFSLIFVIFIVLNEIKNHFIS